MAQITKGTTYTSGMSVTHTNLNNLVDAATLQADAIDAQTDRPTLATTDTFLVTSGATLKKVTLANLLKVAPAIGGTTPAAVTATTLNASGLATVGSLTSTGAATALSLQTNASIIVGSTLAVAGNGTFLSTASFADVVYMNGGANLGNAAADPVVLNCTISGTLKGEPVVDLTSVTAAAADKVLIQDASDANKLKLAAFPTQYVKAFVRANSSGTILGTPRNVASVVRDSQGKYTVTFTTPMTTATYAAVATSNSSAATVYVPTSATASCAVWGYFGGVFDTDFSLTIFEA
tara:strand:- start:425 stop:1300 length:876 start_codon:yes stop_codon:yes gene_type:complete